MGLLKPQRIYSRLGAILGLSGTDGLKGLQDEGVPTQDLTRILQAGKVKQTLYTLATTPAASQVTDVQWADLSDWGEVQVNGIVAAADGDLPQPSDDRIVTQGSLEISVEANYTRSEVARLLPTVAGETMSMAEFGALTTSHDNASMIAPFLLPQRLVPGETSVRFHDVVSGAGVLFFYTVFMLSAEPGVMSLGSGV